MTKESSLQEILQQLEPALSTETFVYVGVSSQSLLKVLGYDPVAFFKEKEGITLIVRKEDADNNFLSYQHELCQIVFHAPFHFDCVGLTAIVTSALAKAGISVIPQLTVYNRSLYVKKEDAHTALEILKVMQAKVQSMGAH